MAVYFSDNIADSTANTTLVSGYKIHAGIAHARTRTSIARVNTSDGTGFQTSDLVRMITLKSSDRLLRLWFASDGATANSAEVDVGLYLTGNDHDGAEADANLFDDALDCASAVALADVFNGSGGSLDEWDRGKTMWELATEGAGTNYTTDPNINFDITFKPGTNFDANNELVLIAVYTSGD